MGAPWFWQIGGEGNGARDSASIVRFAPDRPQRPIWYAPVAISTRNGPSSQIPSTLLKTRDRVSSYPERPIYRNTPNGARPATHENHT